MANPLKVLTALTASSGAEISGSSGLLVKGGDISGSNNLLIGGDLTVGGTSNLQAVTASAVSASGAAQVGGALTVAGASALQGVTATTLSASSTAHVGGTLDVAGTTTLKRLTSIDNSVAGIGNPNSVYFDVNPVSSNFATFKKLDVRLNDAFGTNVLLSGSGDISGSNNLSAGGNLTIAGTSNLQAVTASAVSASSTGQFGGNLTTAGDLTVGGNTIRAAGGTARLELSSGSADVVVLSGLTVGNDDGTAGSITLRNNHATMFSVDSSGNGHFDGDLSIGGTLSVETINYTSSSAITLADKYIIIASGAADHASLDGSAILFGSGSGGYGTHASIIYRDSIDKLEITPGISSSAITGTELHIHGAGSQVLFNGALTVDGTTTVAAVTASHISASGNAQFGGTLDVLGVSTLTAITASAISASGNAQFGGSLTVGGNATLGDYAVDVITVNGQLTASAGIAITGQLSSSTDLLVGGGLTVTGASILQVVSASAVSASGDLQVGGDLTVGGNDIKGSDGVVALHFSGSGAVHTGGDLTVGGNNSYIRASNGAEALSLQNHNVRVIGDLTVDGNDIKSEGGTTVLTMSGSNLTASNDVLVSGDLTVNGVISGDGSGLTNLSASQLNNFAADVQAAMGGASTVTPTEYYSVRQAVTGAITNAGADMLFVFSGSTVSAGTNCVTGSALAGLTGMSSGDLVDALGLVSFDVAVQASGTTTWTNDLVSVQVGTSMINASHYPLFTVSAPSLEAGSKVRLIVVNEKKDVIT